MFYQVRNRLVKPLYVAYEAPTIDVPMLKTYPIPKYICIENDKFTFLNLEHEFIGWNFTEKGMLWAYNQNYFDWLNQEGFPKDEGCKWIDKFIADIPSNKVGLDPYPIALRTINWAKFFCRYPESATKKRVDSLYSQVMLLEKKLEYHLLGNHLLEDAYALYTGVVFFNDNRLWGRTVKRLCKQLKEQILPDGAHFEQSPMYHCILLDRLLDCINFRYSEDLAEYAVKMLDHLESVIWKDGSIPLLNDAAYGIAPTPEQIYDYAKRLGLSWKAIPMKECGYRKLSSEHIEAIVDVGNIIASYQPGHTHADTFNYELRIDGKPFVVDTGISTYDKSQRRQYERGSKAHNCVVVDGKDSSEVWGGFRVGKHCYADITDDTDNIVEAVHDGYGKPCKRRFEMSENGFTVEDWYDGEAMSYMHLTEDADMNRIKVEGAEKIEIEENQYSTEYNKFKKCKVMKITFKGNLKTLII